MHFSNEVIFETIKKAIKMPFIDFLNVSKMTFQYSGKYCVMFTRYRRDRGINFAVLRLRTYLIKAS